MSDIIQQVVHRIAERFAPRKVILFGSQVAGEADEQSDIDLLVVCDDMGEASVDARQRSIEIRRSLADFPFPFDIVVSPANEFERFRRVVNHVAYLADRHGRVVYER